jgi:hypothetical protein
MEQNKRLAAQGLSTVNLQSVIIGNGSIDTLAWVPNYYLYTHATVANPMTTQICCVRPLSFWSMSLCGF